MPEKNPNWLDLLKQTENTDELTFVYPHPPKESKRLTKTAIYSLLTYQDAPTPDTSQLSADQREALQVATWQASALAKSPNRAIKYDYWNGKRVAAAVELQAPPKENHRLLFAPIPKLALVYGFPSLLADRSWTARLTSPNSPPSTVAWQELKNIFQALTNLPLQILPNLYQHYINSLGNRRTHQLLQLAQAPYPAINPIAFHNNRDHWMALTLPTLNDEDINRLQQPSPQNITQIHRRRLNYTNNFAEMTVTTQIVGASVRLDENFTLHCSPIDAQELHLGVSVVPRITPATTHLNLKALREKALFHIEEKAGLTQARTIFSTPTR